MVKYTQEEWASRITSRCLELGYTYKGSDHNILDSDSYIKLLCNKHNVEWSTTKLSSFVRNTQPTNGCPECKRENGFSFQRATTEVATDLFMASGKFQEGTKFWRASKPKCWHYSCPMCSNDNFVREGVCAGVFNGHHASLRRGALSCRCSKCYLWTQEQRELQIKMLVEREDIPVSLSSWVDGSYLNGKSRAILRCEIHGLWEVNIGEFINKHSRCPSCANYGYDPSKTEGYLYVLLAEKGNDVFTGYGVTCDADRRLATHKVNLAKVGFSISNLEIFRTSGQIAWNTEIKVKKLFPQIRQEICGFRREATHSHLYDDVVDFVKANVWIPTTELPSQTQH